jgi:thymidylate kinase
MIISFSGLDGAGKTTQIEMLLDSYRNLGARVGTVYSYMPDIRYHSTNELQELYNKLLPYDVIHIRYRMNSDRNSLIMQTLERKNPPQRIFATFAAIQGYRDHKELSKFVLDPLMERKKVLIFDRYYYDELAFKLVYGCPQIVLKKMYQNERDTDIGFLVKISSEECIKRNQNRPDSAVTLYQSRTNIDSLVNCFDNIAERKNLIILDGSLPRDEIARSVLDHVYTSKQTQCTTDKR